ncbi:hypothetical protein [Curtobacterium poinsettiae]|uniref:hypothetical protein n=1 Tax=Curtobacterium poinsettiae TaxID=159612 RepID=UPI0021C7C497|nr:hypothetical protein [Curtobacterium flaccumfaciens]MCU0116586.1 hypothetical protein [Curtobacterium flaccumfaciens]
MGWAAFEGLVLTGTLVWTPALGAVLVLLPLWLVLRGVIAIVDRSAERAAQRRDMLNGYPPEPRPVSWDNVPMVVVLWWFAIAYVGVFLTIVFLVAFAGPDALESDLSTNVLIGSVAACAVPAIVIGVVRSFAAIRPSATSRPSPPGSNRGCGSPRAHSRTARATSSKHRRPRVSGQAR